MADNKQFGSPRQFGDKATGNQPEDPGHCAQCEAMLADALDGTLSAADQATFDTHMAHCGACSQLLADARRGAAWLEMLRDPRPEPPAQLLERILLQTSGTLAPHSNAHELPGTLLPAPAYGTPGLAASVPAPAYGKVLPFRTRLASAARASSFMLHPRYAMTAAMAFFSIALTLNLTGVRLQDLHASDLSPSSLQRDFHYANARAARYYENLRVVYELESRVHDLQSASDTDNNPVSGSSAPNSPAATAPASGQSAPPASAQPDSAQPASAQPATPDRKPTTSPSGQPPKQAAPSPGTSRREDLHPTRRFALATREENGVRPRIDPYAERPSA